MKQTLRLRFGIVAAIVAFLTIIPVFNASATSNTYVKLGTENLYISSGTKSNTAGTASYNASSKTLTLNGYSGNSITTDAANLKISTTKASSVTSITSTGNVTFIGTADLVINKNVSISGTLSTGSLCTSPAASVIKVGAQNVFSTDGTTATTSPITLKTSCTETVPSTAATTTSNPNTFDPIYIYLAIFAVSSSVLAIRRILAKR